MKLTALEIALVESKRSVESDAHYRAYMLCVDRQDDAGTLSAEDAIELMKIMHEFALVRTNDSKIFAIVVFEREDNRDDLSWCSLQREPNAAGRYECCSSYDQSSFYLQIQSD